MGERRSVPRERAVAALAAVALVAALLSVLGVGLAGTAGSSAAAQPKSGTEVYGRVAGPGNVSVKVRVGLFTRSWTWLRNVTSGPGGVYRIDKVPPGTYWLQISDARPRWNVASFATRDIKLTVRHQASVQRDAILKRGSFVTGTVVVGHSGHTPARDPKLIAAAPGGATFTVTGNAKGQFALAGLPSGDYSLFVYDRSQMWSGPSVWVPGLKAGRGKNLAVRLRTRAAAYGGFLMVGQRLTTGTIWVTAVSKATGQFWVVPVRKGDLGSLKGLYPGRYRLQIPATAATRARTVSLPKVGAGRTRSVIVRVTAKPKKPAKKPTPSRSASPSASPSGLALLRLSRARSSRCGLGRSR